MWAAKAKLARRLLLSDDYLHPDNIFILEKDKDVTITKGRKTKYCIWCRHGIWDIDEVYIDEKSIKVFSAS